MPNWCHNTLKVEGSADAVDDFRVRARSDEQPLSFSKHVPEPSPEVYAAMDEASLVTCYLCGGAGKRPTTAEEAAAQGAAWETSWETMPFIVEARSLAVVDRRPCNACSGRGRRNERESWYEWRLEHWGTKWDASFDGPGVALGTPEADVESSVASQGRVDAPGLLIYRFDTAWSPPTAWLAAVAAEHPDLTLSLRYGEPGGGFAGEVVAHGDDLDDRELPIDEVLASEEMWF